MVVICNPCNPTGTLLSEEECQRAAELCQRAGAWLVMDNTYEHFAFADDAGEREPSVGTDGVYVQYS